MLTLSRGLREGLFSVTLFCFFILMAFGNALRIMESSLFSNHLPVSEALLYLFSFLSLFFLPVLNRSFLILVLFSAFFLLSFFYGCALHGFDGVAFLYVCRLICLFVSCYALLGICVEKFQGEIVPFFSFLSKAFCTALFLGFILYSVFPSSKELWLLLKDYHVLFLGDPHEGRFVSVYFDPNYYACIAGLGFLVNAYLHRVTEKTKYGVFSFLFLLSGILTWSRSGIAVLLLLLFFPKKGALARGFTKKVFSILLLVGVMAFYFTDVLVFLQRTTSVLQEESALCRLNTFLFGLSLWKEYPLFGVGTNFLYDYTLKEMGLSSLDSSLLSLLVQIGVIPFLGMLFYFLFQGLSFFSTRKLWREQQSKIPYFYSWLSFYGVVVIAFASLFNNVLFYPFWAIPFFVVFAYVTKSVKQGSFIEKSPLSL